MKNSLKHINPNSLHDVETLRSVLLLVLQAMESNIGQLKAWIGTDLAKLVGQKNTLAHVLDAFALAHYFQRQDFPTLCALMSDDAPKYKLLSPLHALCWIHDGRDYKNYFPH